MLWYASNVKERIRLMKKFTTLFLITFLLPSAVQAFSVQHDFFITIGAFDASITKFTYSLNQTDYQITSDVTTNGFFDSIYPFQAKYHTSGKITTSQMKTSAYGYESKSRFNTRSKLVFFNQNGEPLYQISSKNDKTKKREFKPSPTPADTFDLQTIFAKIALQYNTVGFCDSRLAVYDGKRRFDVIFKDVGTEELTQNEHSFYAGKANKCTMHIDKLLSEDDDTLWEFSANKPIYFWIARDTKTNYPFIAHIQIKDTPLGELNAYTTKISIKE